MTQFDAPPPFPANRTPLNDAGRLDWLRLARCENVGPVTFTALLNRYKSAGEALSAIPGLAARGGTKRKISVCPADTAKAEIAAAERAGARMLTLGSPGYPRHLVAIHDPPPLLWAIGDTELPGRPTVGIVGARNASALGLRLARALARDLGARGYAIVSGLARGIDAAAHEAALDTGTIAVLAGGVDNIYPPENAALTLQLRERGLCLSEMPIGFKPTNRSFPRRNRIVSGLSLGVAVIEAAARSGSLITARYAIEQGREAMAAPGSPLDPRGAGCNTLIREGAALIRSAEDVIEALETIARPSLREDGPQFGWTDAPAPREEEIDAARTRVIALLGPAPVEIDELARAAKTTPAALALVLLELDLAGRIERRPGAMVALSAQSL